MARRQKNKLPLAKPEDIEIPEEEQWRLINSSGVLNAAPQAQVQTSKPDEEADDGFVLCDELFNTVLLIIPLSFMLVLMEILVHRQYSQPVTLGVIWDRMVSGIPIMSVFIFYTNRHKANRRVQLFLFILSLIVGARMIYNINKANWTTVITQCPPLATIWVYTIVQLELLPAVGGLAIVGAWTWWNGLKLIL
ncbi:hypothetical protein BD410DRAFT_758137 [Rickenella mellea]|uniref:DUF7719 domain-containing protein n=1 Tax=Rickenella mellea TaxID=50990 RepID=A0A4R5XE43_9AGAM|nr:hypothetical protein BD410DRAFT_758137 [Rickenella mellea]